MRRLRPNRILGIAIGQDSLSVAELTTNGNGRRKLLNAADFPFPENLSLSTPAELGRALAQHLRQKGISTRDASLGLPAKWFVTRRKEVPPSSPEIAAASLRLQAEAEFASEQNALAIDYAGKPDPAEASSVLLVATSRSHLDACQAMIRAAGLHLRSVTATGVALASASTGTAGRSAFLHVIRSGAELVIQKGGTPILLAHVPLPEAADPAAALASEMRRALAGVPAQGKTQLVMCANSHADPGLALSLEKRLALPIAPADLSPLVHSEDLDLQHFAPAIAVALAEMASNPSGVNLVNSRLAAPRTRMSRRPFVWAAAVVLALLLAVILAVTDLHSQQRELADMNQRLDAMAEDIQTAQSRADRLAFARAWVPTQPRFLGCLAGLTNLFPDEGSIYATNLSLRENMTGQLSGRASGNQQVLSLLDRMKDDRRFASPKLLDMRDAGPQNREVAFTIAFEFRTAE